MVNIAPKGCINVLILAIVRCEREEGRIVYNIGEYEYITAGRTIYL